MADEPFSFGVFRQCAFAGRTGTERGPNNRIRFVFVLGRLSDLADGFNNPMAHAPG